MQRCPRAFVLRYGIAVYAGIHPTGQMLRDSFAIQTPWILMQMSIRETIRDYVEDYQLGMKWSRKLIQLKFSQLFRYKIEHRNSIIADHPEWKEPESMFQRVRPEKHLEEIGGKRCAKLIQNESFSRLLQTKVLKTVPQTKSNILDGIRVYNSPDFLAEDRHKRYLIRINLFGYHSIDQINQNAALFSLGRKSQTIVQYSWKNGKWFVHKTTVSEKERKLQRRLIRLDSQEMERVLNLIKPKNNLQFVPFADSSRSCMQCSVRFMCPAKHGLEEVKLEQMSLIC